MQNVPATPEHVDIVTSLQREGEREDKSIRKIQENPRICFRYFRSLFFLASVCFRQFLQ